MFEYPVVAVDRQGNLTRCCSEQNLVMTDAIAEVALEMVFIPGGVFSMGTDRAQDDRPRDRYDNNEPPHEVRLGKSFWLGKYPVTKA